MVIEVLTLEETIQLILKYKSEYERKDILKFIKEKRQELGPEVVNDESAAMIVARELGIDLHQVSPKARLTIKDISEDIRNVALTAKVVNVGTVRTFSRSGGGEGKVASIVVADETGRIRIAMWDDQTVAVSEGAINVGDVVQIRGAYVKKGMRDALELNLGRMGNIRIIDDHEMEGLEFDVPESQTAKMNDLQDGVFDVNLLVKIGRIFNLSTFTRKSDGSEGKVLSIIGADETGSARLVFWDQHAEEMQDAKEGEVIRVTGGRTKAGRYGDVEFHTTRASRVERNLKEKIDAVEVSVGAPASEPLGRKNISELTVDMRDVDIEGKVARIFPSKTFERDGKEGKVQNLIVADESGTTRVTFWNDDVDKIEDLQEDNVIRIKHGYVKEGFRGGIEFHVGRLAKIKINPKGSKLTKLDLSGVSLETITRAGRVMIGDIDAESEGQTVEVCGIVVGVGQVSPVYQACPSCRKKVEDRDGKYICSVCGEVKKPEPRMLYKVTLDDGSGSIRVTLFGETGEELLQMTAQEAFDLISKSGNNQAPIEQNTDKILGRYIAIQGRVTKYKDSVDIAASGLDFADPVEEIKRMKQNVADMLD